MSHSDPEIKTLLAAFASPKLATIDLSLARMERLLARLGTPERRLPPVVHVAGTNGKGSLVAYLTAIFSAAGYRVHRYISPHLVKFNERIMLAGKDIDDNSLRTLLMELAPEVEAEPVTFFEATTAAAFMAFSRQPADILLLETGLGGRLDATNLIKKPALTAITPISFDHCEFLGNTLTEIAGEKAGIIKPNVCCVVGPQPEEASHVIERRANKLGASLHRAGIEWSAISEKDSFRYHSPHTDMIFPIPNLAGEHQMLNAATALACVEQLEGFTITPEAMCHGITHAEWPARLQRITHGSLAKLLNDNSELWLDGGHNPAAATILARWVQAQGRPVHLIFSMLKNKDIYGFLAPLAPHVASLVVVPIENEPNGAKKQDIIAIAQTLNINSNITNNIKDAIQLIECNNKNNIILVCGSLYLAGNILQQNIVEY